LPHIVIYVSIKGVICVGQQVSFQYSAEEGNLLTECGVTVLVYSSARPPTTVAYGATGTYVNLLSAISIALPVGAVSTGYNQKCFFGFRNLPYPFHLADYIEFDLNNLPSIPSYNASLTTNRT
jgi:hypothetical protein